MTRMPPLPLLLGFDEIERAFERITRTDGYPPFNVERIARTDDTVELLRIVLAVAGFTRDELEVLVEEGQLVIRGRQVDCGERVYLHRGIAARQFQRVFLLAEGMEVAGADLHDGLLSVNLHRPEPHGRGRTVEIRTKD